MFSRVYHFYIINIIFIINPPSMLYAECVRGLCETLQEWRRSSKHVNVSSSGGACNTSLAQCQHPAIPHSRSSVTSLLPYSCTGTFSSPCIMFNPYPTAFPYGNGMVLHFYQQQESSTTKTVHKVINKGLKAYV